MPKCYFNGQWLEEEQVRIDPKDRGFLLGDGLFETLRCYRGKVLALHEHWQRWIQGAEWLKIPIPLQDETQLLALINQLLINNQLSKEDAGVRITLTRGAGPRGLSPIVCSNPTLLMVAFSLKSVVCQTPIRLTQTDYTCNECSPLSRFKTLAYTERVAALQQAQQKGFHEGLILNTRGQVCSVSCGNIFIVMRGELMTPSLDGGALPGIMREKVINQALRSQTPVSERAISVGELRAAEEVFITNSLIGIRPIAEFDGIYFTIQRKNTFAEKFKQLGVEFN